MKIYAIIAAIVVLLGAFWGVYRMGGAGCREASANSAREHTESQNELLAALEDAKQSREVKYVDKIRVVRESTDNCLGVPMPDDIRLLLPGGGEKQPAPDKGLRKS